MEILSIFGILASINATIITFIGSVLLAFHINDEKNLESIRKDTQDNLNHFISKTSYKKHYGINLIYDKKENNIESLKYYIKNAINDSQRYSNSDLIKINRKNSLQKNEKELIESSITIRSILYEIFTQKPFFKYSEINLKYTPCENDIDRIKEIIEKIEKIKSLYFQNLNQSNRGNIEKIENEVCSISNSIKLEFKLEKESIIKQGFRDHLSKIDDETNKSALNIITGISNYISIRDQNFAKKVTDRFLKISVFQFFIGITIPLILYAFFASSSVYKDYVFEALCANTLLSFFPYSYQLGKLTSTHLRHNNP